MNAASWLEGLPVSERARSLLLRDGPRVATWVLAIALGVQGALILTDLAGASRRTAAAASRGAPLRAHAMDLGALVNAHLFGMAPTARDDAANAPQTSMPLVLTGIIASNDPQNGLAILGQSAQTAKVHAVGDSVPGGAKVHAVYNDRVVIERDGQLESLVLPRQASGNAPPPSAAALQGDNGAIERVRRMISEQPGLLADVLRPQPVMDLERHRMNGFRVYPGRNRAAFMRLGLRPGDQVTAINGTPLDDRERGEQILRTLGSSSEARVTLIRQGQSQELRARKTSDSTCAFPGVAVTGFRSFTVCALAVLMAASLASAQQAQRITPNFKDADITQVTEAVSAATGKNFIIDPRVHAQVTVLSSTPMSPDAFYQTFLSILQVYGFVAVPAGKVIKILPDANARQFPALDLPDQVSGTSDEMVTQVIDVRNVSAAQLVPILRPMIPQYGHLAAYPSSNILIISDRASNVNRIARIIRRIDQIGNPEPEIVPLQNASAAEIVRVVNQLYQGAAAAEGATVKVVADERSNSVLIAGEQSQRLRLRALIAHLDTPLEAGGDTRVRYLHYANAEKIAPKLKEQITGIAQAAAGAGGAPGAAASPQAQAEKNAMVWADPANNALVITAPPKIMHAVMDIIDKLDIRRPQVLVEAFIAEVNIDKSAELGINWAAFSKGENVPAGSFVSPVGGTSIVDLAGAIQNPQAASTTLLQGTTVGIGRIAGTGVNFAAMLRAIRGDTNTNVVATPSAVTMDNQEAEVKVAQEVPFVTGQFTNTAATATGTTGVVNPFQTIQRQEVGTILKVTPTISAEGNSVMLKLSIESSSIGQKPAGAVDLVTNKRTISTTVLIEDGGIVVLGGLIEDNSVKGENRVPYLGNIPLLRLLFKTRNASATKNNLILFIRPKILRDPAQAAYETDLKYNYMRDQEQGLNEREALPLLPGVSRGKLEAPPPAPPAPSPSPGASVPPGVGAPESKAAPASPPPPPEPQGKP